jgi:hypothetical protein
MGGRKGGHVVSARPGQVNRPELPSQQPACQNRPPHNPRPPTAQPTPSFEFADGKLRCTAHPQAPGVPAGTLDASDLKVERVIVLGLPAGGAPDYAVTLSVAGSKAGPRRLAAVRGGVDPTLPEAEGHALVVRAGGAPVGRDWEMGFSAAGVAKSK